LYKFKAHVPEKPSIQWKGSAGIFPDPVNGEQSMIEPDKPAAASAN